MSSQLVALSNLYSKTEYSIMSLQLVAQRALTRELSN